MVYNRAFWEAAAPTTRNFELLAVLQKVLDGSSRLCWAAVGRKWLQRACLAIGSQPVNSAKVCVLREGNCGMGCCTDISAASKLLHSAIAGYTRSSLRTGVLRTAPCAESYSLWLGEPQIKCYASMLVPMASSSAATAIAPWARSAAASPYLILLMKVWRAL